MKRLSGFVIFISICLCLCRSFAVTLNAEDFSVSENEQADDGTRYYFAAKERLKTMTLHEKICQLFLVKPDALSKEFPLFSMSSSLEETLKKYPVGGLVFDANYIRSEEEFRAFIDQVRQPYESSGQIIPWLALTEEGGLVSPLHAKLGIETSASMGRLGEENEEQSAVNAGRLIGETLSSFGLQMNFAPIADIPTAEYRQDISERTFSSNAQITAKLSSAFLSGMQEKNVMGVMKHFPGNGSVKANRQTGVNGIRHTLSEMRNSDLLPYREAISQHLLCGVMASHLSAKKVDNSETPALFSAFLLQTVLRDELGFEGLIVTSPLQERVIANSYSSGKAALLALQTGADLILEPEDFFAAYQSVLQAVRTGTLSEERIDESVLRILNYKLRFGVL